MAEKRKLWLPRFRLRSFLIVAILVGTVPGYYAQRARSQQRAVAWIERNRGDVLYQHEVQPYNPLQDIVPNGVLPPWRRENPKPPGPEFLQEYLGMDYLDTVVHAEVYDDDHPITSVDQLKSLPNLQRLKIYLEQAKGCNFSGLSHLKKVRKLILWIPDLDDISFLSHYHQLEVLEIYESNVKDLTPISNLTHLKRLEISGSPVANTSVLREMSQLEEVYLSTLNFNPEDFRKLQSVEEVRLLGKGRSRKECEALLDELKTIIPQSEIGITIEGGLGGTTVWYSPDDE